MEGRGRKEPLFQVASQLLLALLVFFRGLVDEIGKRPGGGFAAGGDIRAVVLIQC